MTHAEFETIATNWHSSARHARFNKLYTELVYQPMLELLAYLRANGFTTFIVSAGGVEFMRPWSETVYGVPPSQVIGSSIKTKFQIVDGKPSLLRLPTLNFYNDKDGKPVAINEFVGRRPIAAFGNSDGDLEMCMDHNGHGTRDALWHDCSSHGCRTRICLRQTVAFGRLDVALDAAPAAGWTVIDMKNDWKTIFPS